MKAFLSYSRKDLEFTETLRRAMAERGEDFWRDVEGIPLTAEWWREISEAIEKSDNFIFVISPDSVGSDVCAREIGQAVSNNKRLVPILWRETDPSRLDPALARLNWIDFLHGDFSQTVEALIEALNMDCLLYTSPSPRDQRGSRMPSSA